MTVTRVTYPLEAFTLDRGKTFDLHIYFDRGTYRPEEDIINFRGPIAYYVKDLLFLWEDLPDVDGVLFRIDMAGRTFGLVETSVFVYQYKVKEIVEQHQKSLIR